MHVSSGRLGTGPAHGNLDCLDGRTLPFARVWIGLKRTADAHCGVGVSDQMGVQVGQSHGSMAEATLHSCAKLGPLHSECGVAAMEMTLDLDADAQRVIDWVASLNESDR